MMALRHGLVLLACLPWSVAAQMSHDAHAGHVMPDVAVTGAPAPQGVAPAPPADHAADAFYDPAQMRAARAALARESGGMPVSMVMLDRLEYRSRRGADGYHWEGQAFVGGDIDRFVLKTEGEGDIANNNGGGVERAEVQALYSHAIGPYFNVQAGVRHDMRPGPQRSYAVVGIDGLAPYWFDVGATLFVSDKGDVHARIEASYDQRITQRLILQPQAELNFSAQDVPAIGVGSGLSDIELGLRLRYEIAREFAPYVGINWERRFGRSADYTRRAGERASSIGPVVGIRFWF